MSPEKRRLHIVQYFITVFLYWAALYLYVPTLPVYARTKTDNLELIGSMLAMYGLWQALLRLPLGIVSDWVGRRKPFILMGFALAGIGAWWMGSAGGITALTLGRSITGLAAATWVLLVVAFNSLFPPEDTVRATALLWFANASGRMVATAATGALNDLGGYSLAFYLAIGLAVLAMLMLLPMPEVKRAAVKPSISGIFQLTTRSDVLLPALLAAVVQYVCYATTYGFVPILAEQFGASNSVQSGMVSLNLVLLMAGNLVVTNYAKKLGARRLLLGALGLMALSFGLLAFFRGIPGLFISQILGGLGAGISLPTLMGMSIEKVDDSRRSTAMGLHQSVYAVGMFAGPWLSGILAKAMGIQPMFGWSTAAFLALATFNMWAMREKPQMNTDQHG